MLTIRPEIKLGERKIDGTYNIKFRFTLNRKRITQVSDLRFYWKTHLFWQTFYQKTHSSNKKTLYLQKIRRHNNVIPKDNETH